MLRLSPLILSVALGGCIDWAGLEEGYCTTARHDQNFLVCGYDATHAGAPMEIASLTRGGLDAGPLLPSGDGFWVPRHPQGRWLFQRADSAGVLGPSVELGNPSSVQDPIVAVRGDEGIVVAQWFSGGDISFGGQALTTAETDTLLATAGADGAGVIVRGLGVGSQSEFNPYLIDSRGGRIAVAGDLIGTMTLDGVELSAARKELLVLVFDQALALQWHAQSGGCQGMQVRGLTIDDGGTVFLAAAGDEVAGCGFGGAATGPADADLLARLDPPVAPGGAPSQAWLFASADAGNLAKLSGGALYALSRTSVPKVVKRIDADSGALLETIDLGALTLAADPLLVSLPWLTTGRDGVPTLWGKLSENLYAGGPLPVGPFESGINGVVLRFGETPERQWVQAITARLRTHEVSLLGVTTDATGRTLIAGTSTGALRIEEEVLSGSGPFLAVLAPPAP